MFYHGFNGYMKHAFPLDELAPISCKGLGRDHLKLRRSHLGGNDNFEIRGGYCLTLIDSLDTLAILGDRIGFHKAVKDVLNQVTFDYDQDVLTFEVNIRVLGGLLSAHQFCDGTFGQEMAKSSYKGELLDLAHDLGKRLLKAFQTPTGIPASKCNLRHGLSKMGPMTNCPAAAGTYILEFGVLSMLTDDWHFYFAAKKAMVEVWKRRSPLGLIGFEIDVETGEWIDPASTIGAGTDSFYEYLLKGYILFGDPDLLEMYQESRRSIERYMADGLGLYRTIDKDEGFVRTGRLDALAAFYPGMLVLGGELELAIKSFDAFYIQMIRHGDGWFLPEVIDREERKIITKEYNLRPELIESTYYLHQATGHQHYLDVGRRAMEGIEARCRTGCGYAVLSNGKQGERMESFFLSETIKYLYLLFTPDHWVNRAVGPFVFSTEAHLLMGSPERFPRLKFYTCPVPNLDHVELFHQRILQSWSTGLSMEIPEFKSLWPKNLYDPIHTNKFLGQISIATALPPHSMIFIPEVGLLTGRSLKLNVWPSLTNPGYKISGIDRRSIPSSSNINILLKSRKSEDVLIAGKNLDGEWVLVSMNSDQVRFSTPRILDLDQPKCPLPAFPKFLEESSLAQVLATVAEEPSPVDFSGLPVHGAQFLPVHPSIYNSFEH